ncbi:major facilitator superfamily transporter [Penicillium waksmanii]|uniref:major facilitator superfamily transporter n=1 Tax=Penicillium waksmanii TaxID=69791 RepID=UPI002546ED96|nr:major facilitator superfamily transporter [Penicillium waksmanii]KAJ5965866.1 major facilitator superfamily transporter [Penicillium waksmanii]
MCKSISARKIDNDKDSNSDNFMNWGSPCDDAQDPGPPPDGGYGWVCTAAAATINMHSWGFNSAYAVFLAHYLANDTFMGATSLQYAFVGALSLTFLFLASPIATYSTRKLGIRPTMIIGVIFETASLVAASFATKIWHLFLTQGLLFGIGLGLLFIPTAAVVPQWFTAKRSLASGISLAGAGLGGGVYSLSASAMIRSLGIFWAFRILAIIAFVVNSSCIILIKDRYRNTKVSRSTIDISLFRRLDYSLLIAFSSFTMLGYFILIFSLANFANSIGLDSSQAATISAVFNFAQAVGRPIIGYFSDSLGRINMAGSTTFLAGLISLAIWIPSKTYGVSLLFAVSSGLVAGNFWATIGPLVAEVLDLGEVPSGLSLLWLSLAIPSTFSEPIALKIVDGTGSYLGTELFTGMMYIAAAACLGVLRGLVIQQREAGPDSLIGPQEYSVSTGDHVVAVTTQPKPRSSAMAFVKCCFSPGRY